MTIRFHFALYLDNNPNQNITSRYKVYDIYEIRTVTHRDECIN